MVCARARSLEECQPVRALWRLGGIRPQFTVKGVSYGLLRFMLSNVLTLIFSMMSILNFAHAAVYMLGAFFAQEMVRRAHHDWGERFRGATR